MVKLSELFLSVGWYIFNFRITLLRNLKDAGYDVNIIAPDDLFCDRLKEEGFKIYNWRLNKRSLNPINEIISLIHLIKIYSSAKPELVHHFTIKACIYGTIAAKLANVFLVINSVTGLGTLFISKRKRIRILRFFLRPIYSAIFKARRSSIIFQNESDQVTLVDYGIANHKNSKIIEGSGVDINYFKPDDSLKKQKDIYYKILFPARILPEKGFFEVVQAFKILQKEKFKIKLFIASEIDLEHKFISREEFNNLKNTKDLIFLGHVNNMKKLYSQVDIVVLPSWREGLSKSLIESASMEKPIITTDVPGCRDVISHGYSGLLVPPKNFLSIKHALILLMKNPKFAKTLGKKAREKAKLSFEVSLINKRTINYYDELFKKNNFKSNSGKNKKIK